MPCSHTYNRIVNPRGELSPRMALTQATAPSPTFPRAGRNSALEEHRHHSPSLQALQPWKHTRSQRFRVPISTLLRIFYCIIQQFRMAQNMEETAIVSSALWSRSISSKCLEKIVLEISLNTFLTCVIYQITARWPMKKQVWIEVLVLKSHTTRGVEHENRTLENIFVRNFKENFHAKKNSARLEAPAEAWSFSELTPKKYKIHFPTHLGGKYAFFRELEEKNLFA